MIDFPNYVQFTEDDLEGCLFYKKAKSMPGVQVIPLANGEHFLAQINGLSYHFLHATFGGQSWYEIFLEGSR